jgi:hypothetical protein
LCFLQQTETGYQQAKNKGNTPQYFPLITVQKKFRPRQFFEVVWLQLAIPPMRNAKKRTKKQFT